MKFLADTADLAAGTGATFIGAFIGRLDDLNLDGMRLIEDIRTIHDNCGYETQILAASIRKVNPIAESARIGADALTAPPAVNRKMADHMLTDKGLDAFVADWAKTGQSLF